MDKAEALKTIENMQLIIKSNNRAFVSPKQMFIVGIGLLLVPVIEFLLSMTPLDSMIYDSLGVVGNSLSRILVYGFGFYFMARKFNDQKNPTHPLISKAFSIESAFAFSCLAIGLGLGLSGHPSLVYPFIFVLLGMFYNLLGKFINKSFIWVSWAFLVMGPLYMYLTKFELKSLWMYFMAVHGLLTLFIAYYSNKYDRD